MDGSQYDARQSPGYKGYTPLLNQNTDPQNRGDLLESFNIGPEQSNSVESSGLLDPNPWPAEIDGFKEEYIGY